MNHDEISQSNWKDKEHEWLDYAIQDVLCTAFSYARYSKAFEEFLDLV